MLWFAGTGINGYKGLSLDALDVLKRCDIVYVERFTSALSDSDLHALNLALGGQVKLVPRWFVEDGREILEAAKTKEVALVTYGDPLIATTHSELRARAAKNSIRTGVLHAASGIYSIIGETGLHVYKFGRIVTMMSDPQSAISVYHTIFDNLLSGSHTLILTEYSSNSSSHSSNGNGNNDDDHDYNYGHTEGQGRGPFFLDPASVFRMLIDAERNERYQIFSDDTFAITASRVGAADQKIISGKVSSLMKKSNDDFGAGPHSVIITGSLHFTEAEALAALTESIDEPADNSQKIKRISAQMVERYVPKAKQAVQHMRDVIRHDKDNSNESSSSNDSKNKWAGMFEVLDNAEYYIADAERFLRQGKFELAVLSIGYAEGLVDALRFQKGINPWSPPS